jgi:23S rRNA (guanosine2251-2'-O)-methyltransferase
MSRQQDRRGRRRNRSRGRDSRERSQYTRGEQLEGRNVVWEALSRGVRKVHRIQLDERARPNEKIERILASARAQGVPVKRVPREALDEVCVSGVHNGIIGWAEPLPAFTVRGRLSELEREGVEPFFVLVDEANYEHNLGAVLRSGLGAGVNALVIPTRRGAGVTPVVMRVAMGAGEVVPVIREGLSSALATLRRAGVRVVGADMDGEPHWAVSMTGPLALVIGGEGKGLTDTLRNRCDAIAGVPLQGNLESLNLSVTASILMFERARQLAAAD